MPPDASSSTTAGESLVADSAALRPTLLAHISGYSIGRYLSEFLFSIRGLLLAGVLGPGLFGLWTKMKLTLVFLQFAQLGTHEAMLREVPRALGQDDRPTADRIERSVLAFSLTMSLIVLSILCLSSWWRGGSEPDSSRSWYLLAVIFPLSQLYWYLHLKLRAEKQFTRVSVLMVGLALMTTAVGLGAAVCCSLEGFLAAYAASHLLILLWASRERPALPRPLWDGSMIRRLLDIGLPIMIANGLLILLWNIDKLAIWALMSRESLGVYALPSYVLVSVMMIPEAVAAVLYPHFVEQVETSGRSHALERLFVQPTLLISHLAAPAVGLLFLLLPLPIRWWLPEYSAGITPGRILIAALFFAALARLPYVVLVSLDRQKTLVLTTAASCMLGALAVVGLIGVGLGLSGAALGAASSYVLYAVLVLVACVREMACSAAQRLALAGNILLPFAITGLFVTGVFWLVPEPADSAMADLLRTLVRCLVVAGVGALLFWVQHRRLHLLQRPDRVGAGR